MIAMNASDPENTHAATAEPAQGRATNKRKEGRSVASAIAKKMRRRKAHRAKLRRSPANG
jgi:hypothetical protein